MKNKFLKMLSLSLMLIFALTACQSNDKSKETTSKETTKTEEKQKVLRNLKVKL